MVKDFNAIVNVSGKVDASLDKSLQSAQKKLGTFNKALITGAAAAVGAIAGIGKALFDMANEYDGAIDKIAFGTGAAGDSLAGLEDDFKAVFASMPTDMDSAATAIADLNTRLGLSGETLQEVAKQSIQLSDALGAGELSAVIEKSAGALQQFKIVEDDVSEAMDHAFKVSQNTGIGYNELMTDMEKYGPTLQALNYDFEESATLLGSLKKSGVDVAAAMSGMNKAVQFSAKEGRAASDVLEEYYAKIKAAETETEALQIASEVFGKKGATTLTDAIRSGAMSITDLNSALIANTDTIDSTVSATYDGFDEQANMLKNKTTLALREVADKVNKAVEGVMPKIGEIVERLIPIIEDIGEKAVPLIDGAVVAFDNLVTAIEWCIDNWDLLSPAISTAVAAFAGFKALQFGAYIFGLGKDVFTLVTSLGALTTAKIKDKAETIALGALYAKDAVVKGISTAATWAQAAASTAAATATSALGAAVAFLTSPIGIAIAAFAAIVAAGVLVYQNFDKIKEIAASVGDFIGAAFTKVADVIKEPINTIIALVNGVIDKINSIGFVIPDWVPGLGGKEFGINIPNIPMLAKGGFTSGVSIAGEAGTEAVISFDESVRDDNINYWTEAGQLLGTLDSSGNLTGGGSVVYDIGTMAFTPTINVSGDVSPEAIANKLRQLGPEFVDMILDALEEHKTGGYAYGR